MPSKFMASCVMGEATICSSNEGSGSGICNLNSLEFWCSILDCLAQKSSEVRELAWMNVDEYYSPRH